MYKAFIDGAVLHDPTLDDPAALIIDAEVTKQANAADSFTFTVYPDNPRYSEIYKLTSVVEVEKDGKTIFRGRPIKSTEGWENQQTITCEGELAFLNDSVLRPYEYQGTVRGYLQSIITAHNNTMPPEKQFTLRTVTVTDPNDNIVRSNGNYTVTMQEIQEKLVNSLGGYLYIERIGGVLYLDYLADSTKATGQTITISKNLIDFAREQNAENIATGIVPLGATDETTGLPITIAPVNDGRDYITDPEAVARYGAIFVTETWDDVTVPANLLTKARARLTQYTKLVANITLTAVDLSVTDQEIDPIECLDYVTVQDDAHEASGLYLVTARTYNLNDPSKDTVTFGGEQESIARSTSRTAYETSEMPARILKNASARAREILDSSTDGNIYFRFNDQGKIYEIDFLNAETPETATQMWRWNLGGWGFYDKTTDTYTTAATMDGSFLANIITAGILKSDDGTTFYLDLDNGVLRGNFTELKIAGAAGATQAYADQAEADAVSAAASNTSSAISAYDSNLGQQAVFNKLTNNGAEQGIYLQNGKIYINGTYIKANSINADLINGGTIASSNIDVTGSTMTDGKVTVQFTTSGRTYKSILKPAMLVNSYDYGSSHEEADVRYDRLQFVDGTTEMSSYEDVACTIRGTNQSSITILPPSASGKYITIQPVVVNEW